MTTPASTMTYTVCATSRAGRTASVHARTSNIAFDGSAHPARRHPAPQLSAQRRYFPNTELQVAAPACATDASTASKPEP